MNERTRARIEQLGLEPHPEGGYYRETHRSDLVIPRDALPDGYPGDRRSATSILFLLPEGERSAWHRVRSEELWFHQEGDMLQISMRADSDGAVAAVRLGPSGLMQSVVPAGWWQEAAALPGDCGYALVACVVAPGFEFEDFELAED